jgi:threonine dehydratase
MTDRTADFADAARAATLAMRDLFPPTPLQKNIHLSERFGAEIWLKREDLSPVRSYKIRGAFNAMRKIRAADPTATRFICASAGNHAQGVAFVCAHFGVTGRIYMPVTTPEQKILKTKTFGGDAIEIVLTGDFFDETLAAAKAECAETGAHFLSPFDDPDVIEGQASVAVEMMEELGRAPDRLMLPVGAGACRRA